LVGAYHGSFSNTSFLSTSSAAAVSAAKSIRPRKDDISRAFVECMPCPSGRERCPLRRVVPAQQPVFFRLIGPQERAHLRITIVVKHDFLVGQIKPTKEIAERNAITLHNPAGVFSRRTTSSP